MIVDTEPREAAGTSSTAVVLVAPVASVLVLEDRAQIERRGDAVAPPGRTRLEVTGIAPAAVDRSLKVQVEGATLVDARLERRWRQRPPGGLGPDASELRRRLRALEEDVAAAEDDMERLRARGARVGEARADLLRAIAESAGAGQEGAATTWAADLARLSSEQGAFDDQLAAAGRREQGARARKAEAELALARAEEREADLACTLAITVDRQGQAGDGRVRVRALYLVPCACWRPAYRATLGSAGDELLLEAEAVVWQRSGEDWAGVTLSLSTARSALGAAPPALSEDRLATRPRTTDEKRAVRVALREQAVQRAGEPGGAAPGLPGLDDGGEARVLQAPGPASLPSDGQPHRVPLFSHRAAAQVERVCAPERSPLVQRVARFVSGAPQVLLAGPVELVRDSGYVGRTALRFTAPGEAARLSFGSEDGLRVVRAAEDKHDESRLTGRRTTTRTVRLFVSNSGRDPLRVVLEERVPVSEIKEVEVAVLERQCRPAPAAVSDDGIARIELDLEPGGTREARFVWELSAAARVAGL